MDVCIFLAFLLQKLCILFKFRKIADIFIFDNLGRLVFFMHSVLTFFNLLPYDKNCEKYKCYECFRSTYTFGYKWKIADQIDDFGAP